MNIVHVTAHNLFLGGGERLGYNWVENSAHNSTYYSKEGGIDYTKSTKFKTYRNDTELKELIDKHRDDVIVAHDPFISRGDLFINCRCLIWFVHGAFAFTFDVSQYVKPKLVLSNYLPKEKHPSWHGLQTYANHLGVDGSEFTPPTKTPKSNRIIVGIVGRISDEKIPLYFFDFIEKFNKNAAHFHGYEFRFYGKGVEGSQYLTDFTKRVLKIGNVKYMGEVEKHLVHRVYHSLDILVVPSLSETGSYAIVEAQLCGLRVLALDADGIPNHINGLSRLCANYDMMFGLLAEYRTRDGIATRRKQAHTTTISHSLDTWVAKLDKLAEIANL